MISLWALLAVTSTSALSLTGPDTPIRQNDRIEFFGDSITWQGGYLDLIADHLQASPSTKGLLVSLVKRGINGGKSNDLRDGCVNLYGCTQAPFKRILTEDRPAAAVIEIGINDVWHGEKGNSPAVYEQNLRELVASAKALKVPVVLATPSLIGEKPQGSNPLDAKLDQYAAIVRRVGADQGVTVVDLRAAFFRSLVMQSRPTGMDADKGMLTYDGVHMLPSGNAILASSLEAGLAAALRKNPRPSVLRSTPTANSPALVPWPRSVSLRTGVLTLKTPAVSAPPSLRSLATLLAQEIETKTGIKIGQKPGGINLKLVKGLAQEAYHIEVDDTATVSASTVQGLTWGTMTLLQAISQKDKTLVLPRMTIDDDSARPYRGLLIDVARRFHSISVLKQCVELCGLYKINYLQLHLSDDQSFTFPSRAFPLINTSNQHGGLSYTIAELKDLVQFAAVRGVTIVPEMDIPGHSATLVRTMPDLFKIKGTKPYEHHASINFANPDVLRAVDTLIGEMCEVFTTTPYFHMGGDEADLSLADQHPDFQAAFKALNLPEKSQQELYRHFLGQVADMVKRRGKQVIVWEGFGRNPDSKFPIDKSIPVMEFENSYYLPTDLLADGHTLINASWTPLYVVNRHVWPAKKVYEWDLARFGRFSNLYPTTEWFRVLDTSRVLGAQVCSWEGPEESEVENLRRLVPAMAERVWNPGANSSYDNFERRLKSTDALLDQRVHPVLITNSPLDAKDPSGFDVPCFSTPITVTLKGVGEIRYTLDGKVPTADSLKYTAPFIVSQTTTVRAIVTGSKTGYESARTYYFVPPHVPNLATGKKVTVSGGTQGAQTPDLAVDDNLDLASSWWAKAPQWLQVDLGKSFDVNRIEVFPYWDGSRYYQYTVSVSEDGTSWSVVADRSANTTPANAQGDEIRFAARRVRFVKVNMLKGSANEGVHLVELRVWEVRP